MDGTSYFRYHRVIDFESKDNRKDSTCCKIRTIVGQFRPGLILRHEVTN